MYSGDAGVAGRVGEDDPPMSGHTERAFWGSTEMSLMRVARSRFPGESRDLVAQTDCLYKD